MERWRMYHALRISRKSVTINYRKSPTRAVCGLFIHSPSGASPIGTPRHFMSFPRIAGYISLKILILKHFSKSIFILLTFINPQSIFPPTRSAARKNPPAIPKTLAPMKLSVSFAIVFVVSACALVLATSKSRIVLSE